MCLVGVIGFQDARIHTSVDAKFTSSFSTFTFRCYHLPAYCSHSHTFHPIVSPGDLDSQGTDFLRRRHREETCDKLYVPRLVIRKRLASLTARTDGCLQLITLQLPAYNNIRNLYFIHDFFQNSTSKRSFVGFRQD